MRENRIYWVLVALVIWIFGATYWIVTNFCPCSPENGNNHLSKTYELPDKSEGDWLMLEYSKLDFPPDNDSEN